MLFLPFILVYLNLIIIKIVTNALITLRKIALLVMKILIEYLKVVQELLENVNAKTDILKIKTKFNVFYAWIQFLFVRNAIIKMNA